MQKKSRRGGGDNEIRLMPSLIMQVLHNHILSRYITQPQTFPGEDTEENIEQQAMETMTGKSLYS